MAPSKFLVAALATCLIAIGIAAQTGTVHLARPAKQTHAATVTQATVPLQAPQPQMVQPAPAVPAPPPPAAAPVQSNGGQGDGEGDGGGD
ncbi:MAG TPA: hypothetical protein VFK22_05075 [Candidatus Dormibacteraeota bacterium]|nr:hypothetical protein [Candidatus Dormibacteraeota bacterium]